MSCTRQVVTASYFCHWSLWQFESHLWASVSSYANQWGWTRTGKGLHAWGSVGQAGPGKASCSDRT